MRPGLARPLVVAMALAMSGAAARAERLILSLSSQRVQITQSYTGAELVIFGVIERDQRSVARPGSFDVVVTVRGPRGSTVVREKTQLGPIWVNLEQKRFFSIPSTLAVLSNRPVADMAPPDLLRRFGLGLGPALGAETADPRFREALLRLKTQQGLYVETPNDVTFIAPDIFRAPVPVPGLAPVGTYDVTVSLLSGGIELARQSTHFEVSKVGFEQAMTASAHENPWIYGLLTSAMALAFGWLASVIFRRD